MVVNAGHRNPPLPDRLDQHTETGEIGDVQDHDQVGPTELLDRFA
jgi:hypothetical protein